MSDWDNALKLAQKVAVLMGAQEICGVAFDKEKALALVPHIQEQLDTLAAEILPQLPKRGLNKGELKDQTIPLKPFKQDGSLSAVMERFLAKHHAKYILKNDQHVMVWPTGEEFLISGGREIPGEIALSLDDRSPALKDWLIEEHGWEPTLWNFKKDPVTKKTWRDPKTRQPVKMSPKIKEGTTICPNLEALNVPVVKLLVKYYSLSNRRGVLNGWLDNPRLAFDGRLTAGASGITNTHRQRHHTVVNVPKAEDSVLLGKEFRGLFVARPTTVLVGYDAAALESRVAGHYTYRFDGGAFARELLEGDIHSKNCKAFYPGETAGYSLEDPEFSKDDKGFKPFRSKSKNGYYAIIYGCSPPKLAQTLGLPKDRAEGLYNAFWDTNDSLAQLRDTLTRFWETTGQKKWVKGIDGRKVFTRSQNSILNVLFQSCGAIVMDMAGAIMDRQFGELFWSDCGPYYKLDGHVVRRVGYWHDEYLWEAPPDVADRLGQMGVESIRKAGQFLKLRVPLEGEYKVGNSWASTH